MFHQLKELDLPTELLAELGGSGGPMDEGVDDQPSGDATFPAGFTFFGQFVDHDITFDMTPLSDRRNDPSAERNFRTPSLDLDSVYGAGPETDTQMYETDGDKFLIGTNSAGEPQDLPRGPENDALIGDPRNDENLLISQLHLAFLKFHNRIVDRLRDHHGDPDMDVFEDARQAVRWHYQWIVLNEFLPAICDEDIVDRVLDKGRKYFKYNHKEIYTPLEFAGAAYRFGHSTLRERYTVNDEAGTLRLFGPPESSLNSGFEPVDPEKVVKWSEFLDVSGSDDPQPARRIDTRLPTVLFDLPENIVGPEAPERRSLAARNLIRGKQLGLPSGQAVAKATKSETIGSGQMGLSELFDDHGLPANTGAPLWYYVLAEADIQNDGESLGEVGSRIVAESVYGFVESDGESYLRRASNWSPSDPDPVLPEPLPRSTGESQFSLGDLVGYATGQA